MLKRNCRNWWNRRREADVGITLYWLAQVSIKKKNLPKAADLVGRSLSIFKSSHHHFANSAQELHDWLD
jgi:hypothetical protein